MLARGLFEFIYTYACILHPTLMSGIPKASVFCEPVNAAAIYRW